MGPFKKKCQQLNGIFHLIHFCQFYSTTSLVLFIKSKKLQNERKEVSLYIWLFQPITLYQSRQKITSLDTTEFLGTHVCINKPHWQSSGMKIFLCKYFRCTDRLFLGFVILVARCNVIRALWEIKKKRLYGRICVRDITFLTIRPPFYVIFSYFIPSSQVTYLLNGLIKLHNIATGGVLYDDNHK